MPQLSELLDLAALEQHINDRVVTRRVLFDSSLRILNYTARAQYEDIWDNVTRQTRGLIYDDRTGEVVARPFAKFFNFGDSRRSETLPENLPPHQPFVTRKYDGSLGVLYQHEEKWRVATRGSFHSEQAEWATIWLQSKKGVSFPEGWTPLVEIVFAANRIVVDYDFEGLVLIGMVNNETGAEIAPGGLKFIAEANGMRPVEYFDRPVTRLLEENKANEEGYVLAYHVGDGASLRVKVKFEDYCRLHRLVHQTSAITIWEMLRAGQPLGDSLKDTPLTFQTWAYQTAERIQSDYTFLNVEAEMTYRGAPPAPSRKDFAMWAKEKGRLTPLLFSCLDGKDITDSVWKMVRPTSAEPFKQEEA